MLASTAHSHVNLCSNHDIPPSLYISLSSLCVDVESEQRSQVLRQQKAWCSLIISCSMAITQTFSLIIVDEAARGEGDGGEGGGGRGGEEVNVWYGHSKKQAGAHMV